MRKILIKIIYILIKKHVHFKSLIVQRRRVMKKDLRDRTCGKGKEKI